MAKTTTARRTMTAAARAAAKRAERSHREPDPVATVAGRTVLIEAPKNGWEDPPEPSSEEFEEDDPPKDRTTPGRRRLLPALLGILLVAGLVAVAVLGWQYGDARRTESARIEAVAAARKAAPTVLSYDYRHLDRDFTRAGTHLTGAFRDEYGKTTRTVVAPTAKKYHGVVKATIATPASVVSATPDKVVVLLFVNQVTESTQVAGSRLDLNRVRMTMTRTDEGWKVSAVDAL